MRMSGSLLEKGLGIEQSPFPNMSNFSITKWRVLVYSVALEVQSLL